MERRARSSENLRSSGRASQRFSEVVSQGPTAIPAREDVDAAISSVLSTDELASLRRRHLEQQEQPSFPSNQPRDASASNGFPTGPIRPPSAGGDIMDPRPGGVGNGVGGAGINSSGGGGLLDWALWPLWGTIDALKWAGGTVNEVAVAPVIRMASPWGLAGSMLTTVKAFTPQRARDLARVAGNLGLNAAGLARTPAGGEVLRSTGQATGSLSMAVSSPAGRQFLLESATGLVKLAEALDTPESKNLMRQGAVVAARGMDALASRHAKVFVKDLADVVVRLVELANSREATTMAAEFTVNVQHALEMEHMAGIARQAAARAAAAGADANVGRSGGGGVEDDAVMSVGTSGADSPEGAEGAEEEEGRTLDDLVREARLERARQEGGGRGGGGGGGGGGNSLEGPACAGHRMNLSACSSPRSLGGESGSRLSADGRAGERRGERASLDQSSPRVSTTRIITQADLASNRPLSSFRRPGTAPFSPTTPPSDGTVTTGGSIADISRSAASSPSGRRTSSEAPSAAAVSALAALDGPLPQGEPTRGRASTVTGAGFGAGGGAAGGGANHRVAASESSSSGATDAEARARTAAGIRRGGAVGACGESDGTESVGGGGRPAVEYERDGNARLPRLKSEHIASVLRGQPLGLEQQLEAPNEDSVDDTVARASRLSVEAAASPRFPRSDGRTSGGGASGAAARDVGPESRAAAGRPAGAGAARTEAGGWKKVVFACLLLLFAGDGLRHRWKTTFRPECRAAREGSSPSPPPAPWSAASRQAPLGRETLGGLDGGGGGGGGGDEWATRMFGYVFLPPVCQDPLSGGTRAVWVTPSGPCLSPALISETGGGGSGPGCAASFRLCGAAEVVVPDSRGRTSGESSHNGEL